MIRSIKKFAALLLLAALSMSAAMAETPAPTATPAPAATPGPIVFFTATPEPTPEPAVTDSSIQDDGAIRVRLASLGNAECLHLTVAGSYAVEGNSGFRFERGAQVVLIAQDGDVWLSAGGMMLNMGRSVTFTRHTSDEPENGLYIAESEKQNLYNGHLTVSNESGVLRAVLSTDIEEYLYGVVAYEMSDSFPVEALKAQAVAARTYAMERKYSAGTRDYDVVDTTADQVFKGFDPSYENIIAAVDATCGVVGTHNGGFAACYYTASNGGQVAEPNQIWGGSGDDGYIRMKDDPYDLENPKSMVKSLEFSKDLSNCPELKRMLLKGVESGWEFVEVLAVTPANPPQEGSRMYQSVIFELKLRRPLATPPPNPTATPAPTNKLLGLFSRPTATPAPQWEEKSVEITLSTYEDFKDALGLKLNGGDYEMISARETETGFAIEMRRFGHGVGMSQRGAQWMAGQYGAQWTEILKFYYPGMRLERIDWQAQPLTKLTEMPASAAYARPEPTARPTPAPLPALESGESYATVVLENAGSMLNVREMPSTNARVLDKFEHGRKVIVCSAPDENGWVRIRTAELTGYVKTEYLKQ